MMDFYLDTLLHLPHVTVERCTEVEGSIILQLKCLNDTIPCPHCGQTLTDINQAEYVLIRDLSAFGKPVYLRMPRRQFHCWSCHKFCTERLEFVDWKHRHTQRYEQAIYEQVKRTSIEAVSRDENLGKTEVKSIFDHQAAATLKKLSLCPDG